MTEEERTIEQDRLLRGIGMLETAIRPVTALGHDVRWWQDAANRAFLAAQNVAEENQRLRARIAELEAGHD